MKEIVYQFTIQSNVPFNGNENDVVVVRSDATKYLIEFCAADSSPQ